MMDKNEAVKKLSTVGRLSMSYAEDLYDSFFEKPVVPQYVADWYEEIKEDLDESIWEYLVNWDDAGWDDFKRWLSQSDENGAITTLVNMHQFGYEVERETKYRVKMKASHYNGFPQFLCEEDRGIFWGSVFDCRKTIFTRKELEESGFGWVFDCEGIEIEEVKNE